MAKQWVLLLLTLLTVAPGLMAQTAPKADERVLFTVNGVPVTVEEFSYIYSKTNGDKANFSQASLEEYLDLYVKFKLKVARAKEMRLDTIPALREELAGYRRQLADSYLIDRAIGDQLIEEVYQRMQQDVDISHVLIAMSRRPSPEDTLAAYQKAMEALKKLQQGVAFADVAKEYSDDTYTKERSGRVGFITAMMPSGFHRLETAAYTTPVDKVVGPIRTAAGYHLMKVNGRRPARGELEVSHILVRKDNKPAPAAKVRIDSIYRALQNGLSFDEAARTLSEDERTREHAGYLGFFGINRYDKNFEEAAFAVKADGQYSEPAETATGWHIIKRISSKPIQPLAVEKARLQTQVQQDERFEEAKSKLLARIKADNHFKENTKLLDNFVTTLPDTFVTFRWKAPAPSKEVLFTLNNNHKVTLGDFTDYLGQAIRQRTVLAREGSSEAAARELYRQFVNDELLKYEETQLEKRYPEFKALMREYEEGILLFEATRMEVWDKAGQDSVGLQNFYKLIEGKYRWAPRARTTIYRIGMTHADQVDAIREYAQSHKPEEVIAKFNTADQIVVSTEEALYEKDRNTTLNKVEWKAGVVTPKEENQRSRSITFLKIEEILPATEKTLSEARGYIIADYQDQLEREWVEQLRRKYKVEINKKVFESLIHS